MFLLLFVSKIITAAVIFMKLGEVSNLFNLGADSKEALKEQSKFSPSKLFGLKVLLPLLIKVYNIIIIIIHSNSSCYKCKCSFIKMPCYTYHQSTLLFLLFKPLISNKESNVLTSLVVCA